MKRLLLTAASGLFLVVSASHAIDGPRAADTVVDISVPDSPAVTVLGVTPNQVIHPTTTSDFAVGLINAVKSGKVEQGFAVDTSPYMLFSGDDLTLQEYRESRAERLAARTQFSVATVRDNATDHEDAVNVAVSLRTTLWDRGDPRLGDAEDQDSIIGCYLANSYDPAQIGLEVNQAEAQQSVLHTKIIPRITSRIRALKEKILLTGQEVDELIRLHIRLHELQDRGIQQVTQAQAASQVEAFNRQVRAECVDQFEAKHWNASSWTIGVAPTWRSVSGKLNELKPTGTSVYTSIAYGFEEFSGLADKLQLVLHGRYLGGQKTPATVFNPAAPPDLLLNQDTLISGVQLRFKGPEFGSQRFGKDLSFAIEADYIDAKGDLANVESILRYALSADARLSEQVYLTFTIAEDQRGETKEGALMYGSLKLSL